MNEDAVNNNCAGALHYVGEIKHYFGGSSANKVKRIYYKIDWVGVCKWVKTVQN